MALVLRRVGAPCLIPEFGRGDPNRPILPGEAITIPDRHIQSFLRPDGSPDTGWELALPAPAAPADAGEEP